MKQRKVEVFTAGCSLCEEVVRAVRKAACPSCKVTARSTQEARNARAARRYGIRRLPAVVIDGRLADCCALGGVDLERLRGLGLGQPA